MGRIKTSLIKRNTLQLMKEHGDRVTKDFDENKKIVDELINTESKKLRNIIAGYATKLKKSEGKERPRRSVPVDDPTRSDRRPNNRTGGRNTRNTRR
jgi:small subunit ribosomal protein S17e